MKEYELTITAVLKKTVLVTAESLEEAREKAQAQWNGREFSLTSKDSINVTINAEVKEELDGEIRALLVEPGKPAREIIISKELEDLQEVIGGHIEFAYYFHDSVVLICDEEGKIKGLPLNRAIYGDDGQLKDAIAGTFIICKDGEEDIESLSKELMAKYKEKFARPEEIYQLAGRIVVCPMEIPEKKPQSNLRKEHERGGVE